MRLLAVGVSAATGTIFIAGRPSRSIRISSPPSARISSSARCSCASLNATELAIPHLRSAASIAWWTAALLPPPHRSPPTLFRPPRRVPHISILRCGHHPKDDRTIPSHQLLVQVLQCQTCASATTSSWLPLSPRFCASSGKKRNGTALPGLPRAKSTGSSAVPAQQRKRSSRVPHVSPSRCRLPPKHCNIPCPTPFGVPHPNARARLLSQPSTKPLPFASNVLSMAAP